MLATLKLAVWTMREGQYISDHDAKVANWVAYALSGGKVAPGTLLSEQYLLDLEREAFLSLCGEKKTQERIAFTLKTGKPLKGLIWQSAPHANARCLLQTDAYKSRFPSSTDR